MANEHVLLKETHLPTQATVADGTGIEQGTLMTGTDPNSAVAHSAANEFIRGVAAKEKIAGDGVEKLAIYEEGEFRATASGNVTIGDQLAADASPNMLRTATTGQNLVGVSLETATTGQTFRYKLRPMGAA